MFEAYGCVFRDGTADLGDPGFRVEYGARASMTDCLVIDNDSYGGTGAMVIESGATVSVSRTTFRDNRAANGIGCFQVHGFATLTIDDSQILGCYAGVSQGILGIADGYVSITNSRLAGNGAAGGVGLAQLWASGSVLRIASSTITDTNNALGEFAIVVEDAALDFALQLDTVFVDGSVDIYSHGRVLVQNCIGFNSSAVQNASVGTCQSTTDYCLVESCADDDRVGIECICEIDGIPNTFPVDCMQSAVMEIPVPSTHSLTYLVSKPLNKTAELVLSNTGESRMTWTLKNSSNDPGEMAWFVSPNSGTIDPFGEIVVEVVAQTTGLSARQAKYVGRFDIHSDDVCVCRGQSVEMAIELVVTAEVSAAHSYLQVLDATSVEAAGTLVFHIIPVRRECVVVRWAGRPLLLRGGGGGARAPAPPPPPPGPRGV